MTWIIYSDKPTVFKFDKFDEVAKDSSYEFLHENGKIEKTLNIYYIGSLHGMMVEIIGLMAFLWKAGRKKSLKANLRKSQGTSIHLFTGKVTFYISPMAYYVCSGAKLRCSMGSEQSSLEVVHLERPVLLRGEPMANIMDFKPMVNIKPFGRCCSLMNPVVAAATAANYGRLQEMPCIPNPTAPWQGGKMKLDIKGASALLSTSKCMCMWAGAIEITHPGQDAVYEGGPMTITITDPTMETLQSLEGMGDGDGVRGVLGSGFQPASLLPSLQTAIGDVQMPQIPSFVTEMKDSAETLLQKAINAIESGKEKSEEIKSYKAIVKVEGEGKAFQGQEITYKATVYDKDGPVEDCDVRWAIKVGENGAIDKDELKSKNGKRTIAIKMKEEWVDKKEITIMPYLNSNSPDEGMSVKTKVDNMPEVAGVKGETEIVSGQKVEYEVTGYNQEGAGNENHGRIKWAIKIGDGNQELIKDRGGYEIKGNKITLEIRKERIGGITKITVIPYLDAPTGIIGSEIILNRANEETTEITVMPHLDRPTENVSVKTKIGPVAVYITRSNFLQDFLKDWKKEKLEYHWSREKAEAWHIGFNNTAYKDFMKYAKEAKEKLEKEGLNIVINSCMTEEEYKEMMRNKRLRAYLMFAHGNTNGFYLYKKKLNFEDPNWSLDASAKNPKTVLVDPDFFKEHDISRPDLLLVYQVSCENKNIVWSEHLGKLVKTFNELSESGKYQVYFEYEKRIKEFVIDVMKQVKLNP